MRMLNSTTDAAGARHADSPGRERAYSGWLAAGGVAGAIGASACCVLPLLFVMLGVSGAWIGTLTALEPYKPYVATVALGLIGLGFWRVYFRPRPVCENGKPCGTRESMLVTKSALWVGTVLTLLAVTVNWWARLLY